MGENKGGNPPSGKRNPFLRGGVGGSHRPNILWLYLLIAMAIIGVKLFYTGGSSIETDWQAVRFQMLEKGYVTKLVGVRNKGIVQVYLSQEGLKHFQSRLGDIEAYGETAPFYFTIGSIETFNANLNAAQASVDDDKKIYPTYVEEPDYFGGFFYWVFPIVLMLGVWMFIFRRMSRGGGPAGGGGNIFSMGKSRAQIFNKETGTKVTFKDVAGLEEAKVEVEEIVDFLRNPKKYTELGGKIPKGALLVGPPGTGKTLLAKAVAGEAEVPFFSLSGSDFMEMFVGVGASRVRDLFKQAKEKAPCIIFIDEIDAIGRSRSKNASFSSSEERENTLNQLLTEMDGFATNTGIIVLAATNRADILDGALLRAGRFDRQIHVELPDHTERYEIFKVHLRPLKLQEGFDPAFLAKQTPGFSGADIANVCNEAALIAARKNSEHVGRQDFLDAIDRIVGGLERKNKILTPEEKRKVAFHEAGHATVSWFLEHANPLLKVSIIPRGRSLGAAWYVPEERQLSTTEQMFHEMCALLGGRASEDVVFGEVSTGALNDLERVNKMAYAMVAYYGMSDELVNICYFDSTGESQMSFAKPYSERTAEEIDREVRALVARAYTRAKEILMEHREGLDRLAARLLQEEVIFSDDLVAIYGERKCNSRQEELAATLRNPNSHLAPPQGDAVAQEAERAEATEVVATEDTVTEPSERSE